MTFPESISHFKKSHLGVALSLIALGFGGGIWFQHAVVERQLTPSSPRERERLMPSPIPITPSLSAAEPTYAENRAVPSPMPKPPASSAQPLTERAESAVDFAGQLDALSDANKLEFGKKKLGMQVDWDVQVSTKPFYSKDGQYNFGVEPILRGEQLKELQIWSIVPSDDRSKKFSASLDSESIVRVRGRITKMMAEIGFIQITGTVESPPKSSNP